jgi:endonuclease YncB( thermonuclease family)
MKVSVNKALLSIALCLAVSAAMAASISGKVVGVADGDTVTVLDASHVQHKIRLEGIDAPEKAQAFGQRSKENLSKWVFARQVVVETSKNDKYGRAVGKVVVGGVDANLEQVKAGFAWHYKEYAKEQSATDRARYAQAEVSARSLTLGLWRDANPMPPWVWRHGGKNAPSVVSISSGCPCDGGATCTGKRGGLYCVAPNGKKRYN